MSDRKETYEVGDRPKVTLNLLAGDIRIKEGPTGQVSLSMTGSADSLNEFEIDATPDSVTVRTTGQRKRWFQRGRVETLVKVPPGTDLTVHNGSGDITVAVPVSELELHNGAGDVRTNSVSGPTEVKIGSGDIRMGVLHGPARLTSAAGDVRIDAATEIAVSTAAGDLYLGDIADSAQIKSATGDIRVRKFAGTDLEVKTMSGDASIGLVSGMVVNASIKTMSGDFRNRIKPTPGDKTGTMNLTVTSFSGDVTLKSAK